MVEVDGVKYINEKEFNDAVYKELYEISAISAKHFMETGDLESGLLLGNMISESFRNLKNTLFNKKEEKEEKEDE